jgi:hypothetical protein
MRLTAKTALVLLITILSLGADPRVQTTGTVEKRPAIDADEVTKGSKNVDEWVNHPIDTLRRALKVSMETYGFELKKDKPDQLEGTRRRRIGPIVGSGGEKVTVKLTAEHARTRVKIETGKGFVGRLGKKNWSTPIFKEALKIVSAK